jgi:Ca2+-binding EF-hand superfamily protein
MKSFLLGGVAAVLLTTVAPAIAQNAAGSAPRAAEVQTRAEVTARVQKQFARVDADRNGAITQAEVAAARADRSARMASRAARQAQRSATRAQRNVDPAQRFARLDANRDGQLTRPEFDAARAARAERRAAANKPAGTGARSGERFFARLDTNRDGAISQAEFQVRGQGAEERAQRQAKRAQRVASRPQHGGRFGGKMFELADANKDGRLTLQEAQSAALHHFDMADANKDGQVTRDERRHMRQQMRGGHAVHQG